MGSSRTRKSMVAGFAGVLVMLFGLAATLQLTKTNQDIRQSAADKPAVVITTEPTATASGQLKEVIHQTTLE